MNAALLLEHYARIADAPDAIARLRRFVLDLAVRGKLVEQNADDEPASEAAMRIASAKVVQEKTGEVRRRKPLPPISQSEYPYEPPLGWIWERLGRGANITQGFAFASSDFSKSPDDGYPLIKIGDIGGDQPDIYIKGKPDLSYLVQPGELLLGLSGSIKCAVWRGPEALLNQRIAKILPPSNEIFSPWLHLAVHSCIEKWKAETSKLTVQNIKADQLYNSLIPLPPVAEQHRIVAKVDELMALCDQLEVARAEREAVRDTFALSTLARLNTPDPETFVADAYFALANLAPLTTRSDQIKQLRQTILNLAVRGKLIERETKDGSGIEFMATFANIDQVKGRGRRVIATSKIEPSEKYLDIPHHWSWARIYELGVTQTGNSPSSANPDLFGDFIPFVKPGDLDGSSIFYDGPGLSEEGVTQSRLAPAATVMMVCIGATLGKVNITDRNVCFNQQINSVTPYVSGAAPFLAIAMKAAGFQHLSWSKAGTGTLPIISKGKWEILPIPVPPLAEQHRIVAKVDELMALCDQLEASITMGEQTRSRLLEAVLHNALEPV